MYRAIRSEGLAAFLRIEAIPLILSAVIANLFFKWGSFVLELVGFLVLWFVFSLIADMVLGRRATPQDESHE